MGAAAAIIGGTGAGDIIAGDRAAAAGEKGARAQLRQQQAERAEAVAFREETAAIAGEVSPQEIANTERALQIQERDVQQKEALLAAVDPALIEAGKQARQLLAGEEARTLAPIRNQRDRQRVGLEDRLRRQLGSGFETTTAGIQALNEFDSSTDLILAQEQDRSLGRLLGASQNIRQFAGLGSSVDRQISLSNLITAPQRREVQARLGSRGPGAITEAGAPFVGAAIRAGAFGQAIGRASGTALALVGGAGSLTGLLGGMNPSGQSSVANSAGGLPPGTFGNLA